MIILYWHLEFYNIANIGVSQYPKQTDLMTPTPIQPAVQPLIKSSACMPNLQTLYTVLIMTFIIEQLF